MRLQNKIAVVTGAAAGIGRAYAERFLKEGAKVALLDHVAVREFDKLTALGAAIEVRCDVSDFAAVTKAISQISDIFGRIDILLNNAALFASLVPTPFDDIDPDEWERLFSVNVKGVWNVSRAVAPIMRKQKTGRIINVASPTFHKGTPLLMHYVASKGAVIGITRVMARELGLHNITVNAIAPGLTLSDTLLENTNLQFQSDAVMASRALKRDQVPTDLVGTAVFLASDDSAFMTGQTLIVDGGSALI